MKDGRFEVGDAVLHASGAVGTFVRYDEDGDVRVSIDDIGYCWFNSYVTAAVFPIDAANDPWKTSEPDAANRSRASWCSAKSPWGAYVCTRAPHSGGHHVSRIGDGTVNARWPNDVPKPAEPTGPVVGMEVVATQRPWPASTVVEGTRGRVDELFSTGPHVVFPMGSVQYQNKDYGDLIIPAAEWDARQKRDTERCAAPVVGGEPIRVSKVSPLGPPPEGRFDFLDDLGPADIEFTALFIAKLAIALFEEDNAGTIARVADDAQGGIGTAEARARLVWRSAECQREQYMREAAALLKRAGDLS